MYLSAEQTDEQTNNKNTIYKKNWSDVNPTNNIRQTMYFSILFYHMFVRYLSRGCFWYSEKWTVTVFFETYVSWI